MLFPYIRALTGATFHQFRLGRDSNGAANCCYLCISEATSIARLSTSCPAAFSSIHVVHTLKIIRTLIKQRFRYVAPLYEGHSRTSDVLNDPVAMALLRRYLSYFVLSAGFVFFLYQLSFPYKSGDEPLSEDAPARQRQNSTSYDWGMFDPYGRITGF